ncbi:MAG: TonB-dependent receptor [Ignavibacteriales bacterium]|nr:MAG: TonB-dependent receptor [Ignavibacteriales bacterium]
MFYLKNGLPKRQTRRSRPKILLTQAVFSSLLFLLIFNVISNAQETGTITGTVTDQQTGELLIGVNVVVAGTTKGAATDVDGNYIIKNLPAGKYSLKVSFISYSSLTINDVVVNSGKPSRIDIQLKPESKILDEVVISAEMLKSNENSILKVQKNADNIMDVVSAELIKKNNSSDGTDVLKRMTGVAIADGKYAYIRGVSDRYNNTLLNGASLPSTDPEKKSFSYDMFPSSLIENVLTAKTFTPDKPADFSGGLVQINTVEFPSKFFINLAGSSSYNTTTSLKSFSSYNGGKTDFLGYDDGTREKPSLIDETKVVKGYYSADQLTEIGKSFKNNWNTFQEKAPVNYGYKLSLGNKYNFGESSYLGVVGSLTYSNNEEAKQYEKNSATFDGPRYEYNGTSYTNSVLFGALLNTSYKFGFNKISWKNLFNQSSDNDVLINSGDYEYTSQYRETTALRFISRTLLSTQLLGEHVIPDFNNSSINWNASFSNSKRNEPDARQYVYARDISSPEDPMRFLLDQSWTTRFYSRLNDKIYSGNIDFNIKPFAEKNLPSFKLGFMLDKKERDFDARIFGFRNMPGGNFIAEDSIMMLSIDRIFQPENFNSKFIQVVEITKPSDSYTSNSSVLGSYFMFDAMMFESLKLVGGLRYEYSNQKLYSKSETNEEISLSPKYNDILPAINITYLLNERINLRAAYSKTLARPEFRELAPYSYYDFLTSELVIGNPDLKRTLIDNYDLRFEYYPDLGELYAVSLFNKEFKDPIEQVFIATSGFEAYRSYANVSKARSYGVEFEVRKNFGFISGALTNLSFVGNLSLIKSKVSIADSAVIGFQKTDRPMQGQAEYIMNYGLYYENPDLGFSGNVVYNKVGDRISQVGFINVGDIIERARDQVDFSLSQKIISELTISFSAKDILAQDIVFIQKRPGKDTVEARYKKGRNFSLGISYTL